MMLVLYMTAAYPSIKEFVDVVNAVKDLVDAYEVGVPTDNPKYDGPVIRETYRRAEVRGLASLDVLKHVTDKDVIVMAYLEDYERSLEDLVNVVSSLRARSLLLPDILFDYIDRLEEYVRLCERYGLRPSFFISSRFPHRLARRLVDYSPHFVYLGLHASSGIRFPIRFERNVKVIREALGDGCKLFVGFAIQSAIDVSVLRRSGADGIVIGSAFIRILRDQGLAKARAFLGDVRRCIDHGR